MKLISLNIEINKHLTRVLPFLSTEHPDVVCLQEVLESDAADIAKELGMTFIFAPMSYRNDSPEDEGPVASGIALIARNIKNEGLINYWMPDEKILTFDDTNTDTKHKTQRYVLLSADIPLEKESFTVATTHFTWTPDGQSDHYQDSDSDALLLVLNRFPEIALCGDFNIPRGINAIYKKFIAKYTDAIPPEYASSLDMAFHRKRNDPEVRARLETYMVDYLFLTPSYRAPTVRLQSGVSDHQAIVATLEKNEA